MLCGNGAAGYSDYFGASYRSSIGCRRKGSFLATAKVMPGSNRRRARLAHKKPTPLLHSQCWDQAHYSKARANLRTTHLAALREEREATKQKRDRGPDDAA